MCVAAKASSSSLVVMSFATPKSRIFTSPSSVTMMFDGFRSRWTMPLACALASALAACIE